MPDGTVAVTRHENRDADAHQRRHDEHGHALATRLMTITTSTNGARAVTAAPDHLEYIPDAASRAAADDLTVFYVHNARSVR